MMQHGHDVNVPNEESGKRGTSAAGSSGWGVESEERVERVAVTGG
ncbi:MAG: hypothetical protein SOW45_08380 [Prevotella sp.]|nr:hypothetical protein [Prevotellaceae bacterium]MDY3104700.1 hypothetical protein [Prevotella sp.]MDY5844119.1 hypothetical protein [Prevotella sp.]